MHFLIKAAAPLIAGGGLGTGGVYVYRSVIPTTWREYLEREGFRILNTENDNKEFKAIFSEYESTITSSADSILKDAKTIDDYDKIKNYCASELQKNTNGNANTQDQLIKLCTYSGITTAKSKIIQAKKDKNSTDWDWTKEDKYWKAAFAVNRYHQKFLDWINEGKTDKDKINQDSKVSEKHSELKKKCETEWNKKYSDNKDNKALYNHIYWWCSKPQQVTVKERIQKLNPDWKEETDGKKIKDKWEHTPDIKNRIKPGETPDEDAYKNWCTNNLAKEIGDDGMYKDLYLKVKSVCKKHTD